MAGQPTSPATAGRVSVRRNEGPGQAHTPGGPPARFVEQGIRATIIGRDDSGARARRGAVLVATSGAEPQPRRPGTPVACPRGGTRRHPRRGRHRCPWLPRRGVAGSVAVSSASTSFSCCRATSSRRCSSPNGTGPARSPSSASTSGEPGAFFPVCSSSCSWWRSTPSGSPSRTPSGRFGVMRFRPWPTWRTGASSSPARAISCTSGRRHPCCTPGRWPSRSSSI